MAYGDCVIPPIGYPGCYPAPPPVGGRRVVRVSVPGNQGPRGGVSGFLCLGRLFQGQPNEAALCI